jgi:hypothetical protein
LRKQSEQCQSAVRCSWDSLMRRQAFCVLHSQDWLGLAVRTGLTISPAASIVPQDENGFVIQWRDQVAPGTPEATAHDPAACRKALSGRQQSAQI